MDLFTIFHANLAFSSIPSKHYDWVLDNCYWPLLSFIESDQIKTGLEFSGSTLEILHQMDPSIIVKIRELSEKELLEPISGAQFQSIGPLMPPDDNIYNYKTGRKTLQHLLGKDIKVLYLPEQTVSQGILELIVNAGYETAFIEWNNILRFGPSGVQKRLLYQAPLLKMANAGQLRILWNHSTLFQKVQRYIFGEIEIRDVLSYLEQEGLDETGMLCLYGSDLEVFGYFPRKTLQFDRNFSRDRW